MLYAYKAAQIKAAGNRTSFISADEIDDCSSINHASIFPQMIANNACDGQWKLARSLRVWSASVYHASYSAFRQDRMCTRHEHSRQEKMCQSDTMFKQTIAYINYWLFAYLPGSAVNSSGIDTQSFFRKSSFTLLEPQSSLSECLLATLYVLPYQGQTRNLVITGENLHVR